MNTIITPFKKLKDTFIKQAGIMALLVFLFTNVSAQKHFIIKGKILDEVSGLPIPSASIVVKGKHTGVPSNLDGEFKLIINSLPATLVFASVGFVIEEKNYTVKEVKDSVINIIIKLKRGRTDLEEVVVTGVGAKRAERSMGSYTAKVAPDVILRKSEPDVLKSLDGKVAGVDIRSGTGTPGYASRIQIRGSSSLKSDDKFYKEAMGAKDSLITKMKMQTRLLTAGELNDFKKWTMWEDYNSNEFRSYSEKWDLYATQRYSVQLQNNNFKAVIGEHVYLLNRRNGDTVWAAVTDNTGKAELWNDFTKATKENDLIITIGAAAKQYAAIPFAQGVNSIIVNKSCAVSNKVEITFVVDATGSMSDEINYLKEELGDILTRTAAKDVSLDLHTGAVFYRDKGDEYLTRMQQLSPGITNTISFIKNQVATGGGDYPEALKDALHVAMDEIKWSDDARTKIIFLLMDAPPHDDAKDAMIVLIKKAAARGIRIVPVACSGTDKATEFIMRSIALATNGTYLFLTDDSGIGDSHIKPTTDEFKVELLNDLLQRIIEQMCYVNTCTVKTPGVEPITFYNNIANAKVYPNPTTGLVTLQIDKELKAIYVTDFTGKIIMYKEVKEKKGTYSFDLSNFPSATYLVRYIAKDNTAGAEKIILVR